MPALEVVADVLTGFRLISGDAAVVELTKENINDSFPLEYGRVYNYTRELMDRRSVLDPALKFETQKGTKVESKPVLSPIVEALCNLYNANFGVIYVMYAPPGQGKTFGGQAFLKHWYQFDEGKNVRGFMVTGQSLDKNYMLHLRGVLKAKEEMEGWIHPLLLALDEPEGCQPSLLILDGFNSLGEDDVNEAFIKELYGLLEGEINVYVVIMSSNEAVASKMCSFNGGQRIQPLPNTYEGEKAAPKWNDMKWSREQLIEAIKYDCPGDFSNDDKFEFITNTMTPLQATMEAKNSKRQKKLPGSPKKRSYP